MKITLNNINEPFKRYKAEYNGLTAYGYTRLIAIKNLMFKLYV